ncbi:EAL and HDOD domain-containing protein [Chitinimonas taiwanensis]|jgi:EAL and modified HD-GYP domain-containing signal transduction protein|uniref:EAL and modified HD-GYP domain-containing signal transduction protein n=1 Tax=Chitinimonas taiwanensis DSM 18899 TaxID=1121279 RepID=A0A1K2HRE4_9NEIS|nr:EAL domain-containing protein [Chitinimonas taiwanensis]SFZ79376.1 EAL and modified HD-GYP domain-containing signal transduction protein [Chitinimonas taiwanensis DSM 18899]
MQNNAFIGRQPILNRQQQIIGYELLFRLDQNSLTADFSSDMQAGTNILVNTLSNMGADWLVGSKMAFVNVATSMLESNFLELLHPQRVVLEIVESVNATPELLARAKELRAQGFGIALDDFTYTPQTAPFLEFANYVKLDIQQLGLDNVKTLSKELRKFPVLQVAEKVETKEEFKFCLDVGLDCFQGYYFAHPETLSAKVINPAYANILGLLNMLRNNAEISDIENALKRDVALSFKLLRYINSAGFGLSCEIHSFRHAVTILGYQKLYRWLTLLLVTASSDAGTPPALMKTAVTRGRLVELLGSHLLDGTDRDNLFIVGVFSLLDVMLDMPMEKILETLLLPDSVSEALLSRVGMYGPFLELAEACEDPDMTDVPRLCEQLQLTPEMLNKAHVSALAWVEELGV